MLLPTLPMTICPMYHQGQAGTERRDEAACIHVFIYLLLHHTHTHLFNGPCSRTTQVSRYQKGKTNLDFTEVRDSEWQWHQLGRMQVCTSLQTDNHTNTPRISFSEAGCPSCHPTNSVKALKAILLHHMAAYIKIRIKNS